MRLVQKVAFSFIFLFFSSVVLAKDSFAAVDIKLEDNKETKTISVIVNSNDSYIDGIDLSIKYSEDITIEDVVNTTEFCLMGISNEIFVDNVEVTCFNDTETTVNGVLATIQYIDTSDDYYFYVDTKNIDLASLPLGNVEDVNKPEITEDEDDKDTEDETKDTEEETTFEKITNFLNENSLYVLAGVITLLAIVVAIVGFFFKKD